MLNRLTHLLLKDIETGEPRCSLLDPALPSWQRQEIRIPGQNLLRLWREGDADLLPGERLSVHRYLPQEEADPFWHAHAQPMAVISARDLSGMPGEYVLRVGAQNLTGGFIKDLSVMRSRYAMAYEHTNPMSAHAITVRGTWYSVMLTYTGTERNGLYDGLVWPAMKGTHPLSEIYVVRRYGKELFDTLEEGL